MSNRLKDHIGEDEVYKRKEKGKAEGRIIINDGCFCDFKLKL